MHLSVSIELAFDATSTRVIRDVWRHLERLGVSRRLSESATIPHVSLALFPEEPQPELTSVVEAVARRTRRFELPFSGVAEFDSAEGVVYLVPGPASELHRCHSELHERLAQLEIETSPLYLPGAWVPHCTVAVAVATAHRPRVLALARELAPHTAMACCIRAFHYGRGEHLAERELRAV